MLFEQVGVYSPALHTGSQEGQAAPREHLRRLLFLNVFLLWLAAQQSPAVPLLYMGGHVFCVVCLLLQLFYSETNTYTMLPHPHHISPGSAPEHFDSCRANSCAFLLVTITHRDTQPQPHTHFFSNSKVDSGMLIIVKWGSQQVLLVFKYKREINLQTLTIIDIEMKNLKLVS